MIFNSVTFLIFFLVFFNLYWLINNKLPVVYKNLFTVLSSYLFYGWWDWRFISLIIISSGVDYSIGLLLGKTGKKHLKSLLLITSIVINLGILGFFKYFNFFLESLTNLLSVLSVSLNVKTLSIILPVGISFYTFQTLSYTIDIYRGKIKPTRDILSFFAFVAFFPQLVAGPIERAANLLPQFKEKKVFSYQKSIMGLRLILWGLFKKLVIADNFGVLADILFDKSFPVTGFATLAGAFFFALQIYADFSGYSDIAIGVSRMLGIELMNNFAAPYFSSSLTEFWHRWHISLSTWFRDYVYIPLGGNRGNTYRVWINIFITFVLSGLWHGAQVTFLIWGTLHGIFLLVEKGLRIRAKKIFAIPFVFFIVLLLWIPFRAESFEHLLVLLKSLVHLNSFIAVQNIFTVLHDFSMVRFWFLVSVVLVFFVIEYKLGSGDFSLWISRKKQPVRLTVYYFLILIMLLLGNFNVKPYFIYFQF